MIFTEPEENNYYWFSRIALVIIRETAFSLILLVSSFKISKEVMW